MMRHEDVGHLPKLVAQCVDYPTCHTLLESWGFSELGFVSLSQRPAEESELTSIAGPHSKHEGQNSLMPCRVFVNNDLNLVGFVTPLAGISVLAIRSVEPGGLWAENQVSDTVLAFDCHKSSGGPSPAPSGWRWPRPKTWLEGYRARRFSGVPEDLVRFHLEWVGPSRRSSPIGIEEYLTVCDSLLPSPPARWDGVARWVHVGLGASAVLAFVSAYYGHLAWFAVCTTAMVGLLIAALWINLVLFRPWID